MSSSDDLDAFDRAKRDGVDQENNDQDSNMDEKLVDAEILYKKMGFDKRLPKSWVQRIESNEIDYNTASKYFKIKKIYPIFILLLLGQINNHFGQIGLVLYSSLKNLKFFDIEKHMLQMSKVQTEEHLYGTAEQQANAENSPVNFIKPIMIYYLNSVKKYYNTRVNSSEEVSGSSSDSEEDIGESNRDLKVKKKEFKFSLNNLKTFLAVAP